MTREKRAVTLAVPPYPASRLYRLARLARSLPIPSELRFSLDWRFSSGRADRKSTRLNSSHLVISYAVFCLKKKKKQFLSRLFAPGLRDYADPSPDRIVSS